MRRALQENELDSSNTSVDWEPVLITRCIEQIIVNMSARCGLVHDRQVLDDDRCYMNGRRVHLNVTPE